MITRIRIDLSFLIMISIIKTIITISSNNNNSSHTLFKNNNVDYLKFVDLYKSSAKTQTSLLNRIKINLVSKTQTSTNMIIKIRLNFTIMNFKGDLLLKYINMISKIKKTEMSKSNIMFIKTFSTKMSFNKKRNFIIIIVSIITIVSTKKLRIRIS